MKRHFACWAFAACSLICLAETPAPVMKNVTVSNGVKTVTFTPAPAITAYTLRSGTNLALPLSNDLSGVLSGTSFRVTNAEPMRFYGVAATPMSSNALLTANLLNRIAYGPTPDELLRVAAMGPHNYIIEQLAPENLTETIDAYTTHVTNGVPAPTTPQWQFVSYNGFFSSSNVYMFLTKAGEGYIDDISIKPLTNHIVTNIVAGVSTNVVTNFVAGAEVLNNGGFENPTLAPWVLTANMSGSTITNGFAHSGNQSLHLRAASTVQAVTGNSRSDSIYQDLTNLTFNFTASTQRCQLSFWYLPTPTSSQIKMRLSGSGLLGSGNNEPPAPEWIYATATGTAGGTPALYLFLSGAGECYIDDIKLVAGSVPEVGPNLARNGDFEAPLTPTDWNPTANFTNSFISSQFSHSGSGSLKIVASAGGSGSGNSIVQASVGTVNGATYTVSFWYLPPTRGRTVTARLSGSGLVATEPNGTSGTIRRRLDNILVPDFQDGSQAVDTIGGANLRDLRAWHVMNAVGAKRQLIEVLTQFLENHFVTQHAKSVDYFDRFYDDGNLMDVLATDWEYREITKWRQALLNPNCNFNDLLRISAESPAMIVYLDTVDSRGNLGNVANENYAREILELFTMGADNGYDQNDIIVMSRAWTGWSVDIVDPENINNPHARQSLRVGFYPGVGSQAVSNLVGAWTFNYKPNSHGTNRTPMFSVYSPTAPATNPAAIGPKIVPSRFGPPWAGTSYQLVIPRTPAGIRSGTNGIMDGYDVINHLADLPFTMEYISVKLCRLFIHEDFEHGVYDYTDPNRSAEAELIRRCMVAWNTPVNGRKGNIRSILNTIFDSDLFRSHGGSLQKVKTPLEFAASTIRALRSTNTAGQPTASTDGYSISGRSRTASTAPLTRMGSMMLFDRDAPDGYPETGAAWISSGTLAERIRFVQSTLMSATDTNKHDTINDGTVNNNQNFNRTDPVGLLKAKLPSGSWNDAGAVSDFFLGILFPAEGSANLDSVRTLAINFLNTNDNGVGTSFFASLGNTTPAYDTRVRAMVSMLMTLPRFQEQ